MDEILAPRTHRAAGVGVLGEALVDAYPDGTQVPGGAPFNVARWLAAFGVPTLFVSRLGAADAAAAVLHTEMARFGLGTHGVQADPVRPTGLVRVLPALPPASGHRFEIAENSAWDHLDADAALPLLQAAAPAALCFGSLALRHADSRAAITRCVAETPALRVLDLNLREVPGLRGLAEHALQLGDWVKVNDEELHTLLAWFVCGGSPVPAPGSAEHRQALQALSQRFAIQRWVVTCGAQGWYSADAQGQTDAQGAAVPLDRLQDTVGAGDAFTATVLAGQAHGWPLGQTLAAANRLAAAVCTWRGALPADDATVRHWRDTLGFGPAAPDRT
jgi:fructokinase